MKRLKPKIVILFFRLSAAGVLLTCLIAKPWNVFAAGGNLKKAKQYFEEGLYNEAFKEYNDALTEEPDSSIINFGAGCTNYKKDNYQEAVNNFNKGLLTEDNSLKAKAYYNLGSSKYRLAESQEAQNIDGSVSLYREAAEYYKKAIKSNPKDMDAKYNYEFAVKKLKAAADKAKQQSQQEQNQNQNKDQGKDEAEKEQQEQGQEQKSQPQEQREEAGQEDKEAKAAEDEKRTQESAEEKEGQSMSKEEAMMLIDSFSSRELEEKQREKAVTYSQEYQDW